MTPAEPGRVRTPWHLWVVAAFFLATYVGGARDYLLILFQDQDYLQNHFGPEGTAYFTGYPLGFRALWTITVVGGLSAPALLFARSRLALPSALAATLAQLVLLPLTFALRDRWDALGAGYSLFDIGVGVATALLTVYCWRLRARRVLR